MTEYSTWVVDTQTGVKQRLTRPISGTWERSLNGVSQGTHVFRLDSSLTWQQWNDLFDGWRRMIVVCWNDVPVYAGFIVKTDYDYPKDRLTVSHASFRAVLARRFPFGIGQYVTGTVALTDRTLRGIAYQLIFEGTQGTPSAVWPLRLRFTMFDEVGGDARTYFNYAYQSIEQALTELTNTQNGPDIDFVPEWDSNGALQHLVRVGAPYLTGPTFEFNASSSKPSMVLRTLTTDFTQLVTGVFALGKGSGEIKRRGEAATVATPGGYISLDVTRSFTQVEDPDEVPLPDGTYPSLNSHAAAEVTAFSAPIRQYAGEVLAAKWLPDAMPGANVSIFRKQSNWRPAEWINLRVIGYSGDIKSQFITLKVA